MIITVDGPAAAGKGVLTRKLADHFKLARLDTGLLYRAVGWAVLTAGNDPEDAVSASAAARSLTPEDLENPELRSEAAGDAASKVAAIGPVRDALLDFQRSFAAAPPHGKKGAVFDGRDTGTVICPEAPHKLFLTASVEKRAERRLKELQGKNVEAIYARVLRDMQDRDERDQSRSIAPLEPAKDALVLDTSDMDPETVFQKALEFIMPQIKR
jgi:cytidylate kinase